MGECSEPELESASWVAFSEPERYLFGAARSTREAPLIEVKRAGEDANYDTLSGV